MPRRHEPTSAETLDQLKTTNKTIFRGMSPGTKTGLMAAAAFFLTFVMFAPKPTPPKFYTGCELKGAIERCAEIMAKVKDHLPIDTGAPPSRADQIKALEEQDWWANATLREEATKTISADIEKYTREKYKRRGVKD